MSQRPPREAAPEDSGLKHRPSVAGLPSAVLVIDDSDFARAELRTILSAAGMQVFEQPSAIGASRNILRNDIRAMVVDVSMPGLSGDGLVAVLRTNKKFDDLIIVVVTGREGAELREVRERVDADAVLSKGDVQARLIPTLREASSRRAARAARGISNA